MIADLRARLAEIEAGDELRASDFLIGDMDGEGLAVDLFCGHLGIGRDRFEEVREIAKLRSWVEIKPTHLYKEAWFDKISLCVLRALALDSVERLLVKDCENLWFVPEGAKHALEAIAARRFKTHKKLKEVVATGYERPTDWYGYRAIERALTDDRQKLGQSLKDSARARIGEFGKRGRPVSPVWQRRHLKELLERYAVRRVRE